MNEQEQGGGVRSLNQVVQIDDGRIAAHLDEVVRSTVEETLNALLDAEADRLCGAQRYERNEARQDTRAGSYQRQLQTKAGEVSLKVPKLRSLPFETAIIERYKRRESSVEEALVEMYLGGSECAASRGHHGSAVGYAGVALHGERVESEDLCADRGVAAAPDRETLCVRVPGWGLAEAKLGRRSPQRERAGGDWRGRGRLPARAGRERRHERRRCELDRVLCAS
jgi:hypothetical protein